MTHHDTPPRPAALALGAPPRAAGPRSSILATIGDTPCVRINHLGPAHAEVFVKLEAANPGGSVKDRFALAAITAAEASGALQPGQTVVEATSGNTGIALAMVCAQKGYPLVVTMAENFSLERRRLMRFLGAKVVLTPASAKGSGMIAKAEELAAAHGWFLARQFENEANADMHAETTAREILRDFAATGLDHWVTGYGTGGTLKGVARVLRAESPATQIVLTEPDNVPILASGIPQDRDDQGRPSASHPMFRPHLMQGWSPDIVPKLAEDAQMAGAIDLFQPVSGAEALDAARAVASREGILCGLSGGATFAAARKVAARAAPGARVLAMLPATGERYLSTVLFDHIAADMSAEEAAIARSTPGYRFDAPARASAAAAAALRPEVAAQVEDQIATTPVLMYALECVPVLLVGAQALRRRRHRLRGRRPRRRRLSDRQSRRRHPRCASPSHRRPHDPADLRGRRADRRRDRNLRRLQRRHVAPPADRGGGPLQPRDDEGRLFVPAHLAAPALTRGLRPWAG